jgi:formylglycine-generating enzyme required for sulfatase activity
VRALRGNYKVRVMAGKVFINYRREDAKADAGRIHDRLSAVFDVFMDVDHLKPGQRFDQELDKALSQSDTFLAVIGPRWLELLRERAQRGNHDYVRQEIALALARGIFVVPVLVGGAHVPRRDELPGDLQNLVLFQKHDIVHERFGRDVAELIDVIKTNRKPKLRRRVVLLGCALAAIGGLTVAVLTIEHGRPWLETKSVTGKLHAGQSFRECPDCPEMVMLPAGKFVMGSAGTESGRNAAEGPQHEVTIAKPFAAGKYEITVKEYDAFIADTGGVADGGGCNVWTAYGHRFERDRSYKNPSFSQAPSHPAVCISWQAAATYANWLTMKTHHTYRLLSEAEWEYAARAGSTARYFFGDSEAALCEYGNGADRTSAFLWGNHLCSDGVGVQTSEAGRYKPNAFGLYDVIGNAAEWVQDCWHPSYVGAPPDGSPWMSGDCSNRVNRGGAWDNGPKDLRSATRGAFNMQGKDTIGFRMAREIE